MSLSESWIFHVSIKYRTLISACEKLCSLCSILKCLISHQAAYWTFLVMCIPVCNNIHLLRFAWKTPVNHHIKQWARFRCVGRATLLWNLMVSTGTMNICLHTTVFIYNQKRLVNVLMLLKSSMDIKEESMYKSSVLMVQLCISSWWTAYLCTMLK